MTPATNAIVASLPRAKQGVASAVNDTARELGAAFGVAVLGSAFNTGYRNSIDDDLGGLPAYGRPPGAGGAGDRGAGRVAHPGRRRLADAAREAFTTGMRYAVLLGMVMLLIGARCSCGSAARRAPKRSSKTNSTRPRRSSCSARSASRLLASCLGAAALAQRAGIGCPDAADAGCRTLPVAATTWMTALSTTAPCEAPARREPTAPG